MDGLRIFESYKRPLLDIITWSFDCRHICPTAKSSTAVGQRDALGMLGGFAGLV